MSKISAYHQGKNDYYAKRNAPPEWIRKDEEYYLSWQDGYRDASVERIATDLSDVPRTYDDY